MSRLFLTNISTSSGLTEATFTKNGLTQGYWFYGYADNGSGGLVKADGLREFLVGPALVQNDVNINSFNNRINIILINKLVFNY